MPEGIVRVILRELVALRSSKRRRPQDSEAGSQ
jgi:hypothetical protein